MEVERKQKTRLGKSFVSCWKFIQDPISLAVFGEDAAGFVESLYNKDSGLMDNNDMVKKGPSYEWWFA